MVMAKEKKDKQLSFEESLLELENIAQELEDGSIGLDAALAEFERGVGLLRRCYVVLESAEGKIAELTGFDADGNPVERPFDASATAEAGSAGRRKSGSSRSKKKPDPDADENDPAGGLF